MWEYVGDGAMDYSTPAVYNGNVYVATQKTQLFAIMPRMEQYCGAEWTNFRMRSSPIVAGGTAYFGSDDDMFYSVNAANRSF